jgi:hypothetical protein
VRIVFSVLSLLVVVAVIGFLAKKQLTAVAPTAVPGAPGVTTPMGTPKQQVQQFQQSVQDAVQQTPRTVPDDTK